MLSRLLALAVLGGLGVGLVLRIWFGRSRFGVIASLATLPALVHTVLSLISAFRADVPLTTVLAYVALALGIVVIGALFGHRNVDSRPWLSAFTPLISTAVYSATALVLISLALRSAGLVFDVLATTGMVTGTIFLCCVLVPFAPPAFSLSGGLLRGRRE